MIAPECPCWASTYALGHTGHCCFTEPDPGRGHGHWKWRELENICHVPADDPQDSTDPAWEEALDRLDHR